MNPDLEYGSISNHAKKVKEANEQLSHQNQQAGWNDKTLFDNTELNKEYQGEKNPDLEFNTKETILKNSQLKDSDNLKARNFTNTKFTETEGTKETTFVVKDRVNTPLKTEENFGAGQNNKEILNKQETKDKKQISLEKEGTPNKQENKGDIYTVFEKDKNFNKKEDKEEKPIGLENDKTDANYIFREGRYDDKHAFDSEYKDDEISGKYESSKPNLNPGDVDERHSFGKGQNANSNQIKLGEGSTGEKGFGRGRLSESETYAKSRLDDSIRTGIEQKRAKKSDQDLQKEEKSTIQTILKEGDNVDPALYDKLLKWKHEQK